MFVFWLCYRYLIYVYYLRGCSIKTSKHAHTQHISMNVTSSLRSKINHIISKISVFLAVYVTSVPQGPLRERDVTVAVVPWALFPELLGGIWWGWARRSSENGNQGTLATPTSVPPRGPQGTEVHQDGQPVAPPGAAPGTSRSTPKSWHCGLPNLHFLCFWLLTLVGALLSYLVFDITVT